uniref:CBF1-interacting co-repressor CIR N-terminal domain-containing protein n=1 Tax=Timema genevievae TaxID=629358 RepID=A0A7R9PHA7_TIMGE|nr:unnamed protein product [Timema genevievae]
MNILPKKRWHVRTKENIARVRKDEAQAAEEEKERQRRTFLAEQEARTKTLREKSRKRYQDESLEVETLSTEIPVSNNKHVNLFEDIEDGTIVTNKTNAEFEKEQKEEKEKYEKQIGYLTYLGQDTVEVTGNVSWYNKVPNWATHDSDNAEVGSKSKVSADPLNIFKKFLPAQELKTKPKVKPTSLNLIQKNLKRRRNEEDQLLDKNKRAKTRNKHKNCSSKQSHKNHSKKRKKRKCRRSSSSSSSESSDNSRNSDKEVFVEKPKVNLEHLRAERLRREREEQKRTEALLAKIRGEPPPESKETKPNHVPIVIQKYNSQFNPELARQNFNPDEIHFRR